MKSHIKKKAFTLTELLVVVIVIGVLSAVVLPKFSKVVETRKTTEAEEIMAAVRTEQEKRCMMDKNYFNTPAQLAEIMPSKTTKNFTYNLTPTGMTAQSEGKYRYELEMPSYADGRLCCTNAAECAKLNKDYPLCENLIARADYKSGAECAAGPVEKSCSGSASQPCGCLNRGTQTRTCDTSTGTWGAWSACSISNVCDCTAVSGAKPASKTEPCNSCGMRSSSYVCNAANGQWTGIWSQCSKTAAQCACQNPPAGEPFSQNCPSGYTGTQTRTWNASACRWNDWQGECTPECTDSYGVPSSGLATDSCDGDTVSRFVCSSRPGFKGTCTDAYTTGGILSGAEVVVDWDNISIDKIKNPTTLDPSVLEKIQIQSSLKGLKMPDGRPAPSFYYARIGTETVMPYQPIDQFDNCPHGHCCCYTCDCYERTPGYGLCPGVVCVGVGNEAVVTEKPYHRKVTCCGN